MASTDGFLRSDLDKDEGDQSAFFDPLWLKRVKITFDNTNSGEDLINFPVLIRLDPTVVDFSKILPLGADIRFIDDDGTTELDYEIEFWDDTPGSESAIVWVRVPTITKLVNTDFIHLYYNNAAASDDQNAAGVWDSNHIGVWHLDADSDGTADEFTDSSGTGNPGTGVGFPAKIAGQVGNGQDFDGSNDYINEIRSVIDDFDVDKGTVSAWCELNTASHDGMIFDLRANPAGQANKVFIRWLNGTSELRFNYEADNIDSEVLVAGGPIFDEADGKKHLVAMTWDTVADEMKAFIDGEQVGTTQTGLGVWLTPIVLNENTAIGAIGTSGHPTRWTGMIDEVRVSKAIARSPDWMKARYLSENNVFKFANFGIGDTDGRLRSDADKLAYRHDVFGVPAVNIGKVFGVPTATIDKVFGVN